MSPAMLDDPTAPTIYRMSGEAPFPLPHGPLPPDIMPKQVTLRDRITTATLLPFSAPTQVPPRLAAYLCDLLNLEIEKGDTYPMIDPLPLNSFAPYWFANFGAIMLLGDIQMVEDLMVMEAQGCDWSKQCLGSFYIKPNYPGRSSHVCNGGFLVTDAARNRGVGRLMGEGYLDWAPKLGYTYSVFNLVYETNVASLRIWDALGFKRIGRVKGCGNLKSHPDGMVDAIIFGRDLGVEGDEYVTEERFDKIRFYLKTQSYPAGSDRAEKSRLRSAATHYRLEPSGNDDEEDKLMLKGKEVVSDPHKQYEIARSIHSNNHGGINKTTAVIAEKYHWVRIKETVSLAIKNCLKCQGDNPPKANETATTNGGKTARKTQGAPMSNSDSGEGTSQSAGEKTIRKTKSRPGEASGAASPSTMSPSQLQQPPQDVEDDASLSTVQDAFTQQHHLQQQVQQQTQQRHHLQHMQHNTQHDSHQQPQHQQQPQHYPGTTAQMMFQQPQSTAYDMDETPVDPQIMQWAAQSQHFSHQPSSSGMMQTHHGSYLDEQGARDADMNFREQLEAQIMDEDAKAVGFGAGMSSRWNDESGGR
ncbi:hypothetical protein MBLNU230_g1337t1 [Neophaeotheca triangularis]